MKLILKGGTGPDSNIIDDINKDNAFDIAYYEARGISLEVSVDGAI
jgi:hypothetical protein